MRMEVLADVIVVVVAAIAAFIGLEAAHAKIDLGNLAKGDQNTLRIETYEDAPYTACTMRDIKSLAEARTGPAPGANGNSFRILWLGNSQLHYINQYVPGDHLAPYWLRQDARFSGTRIEPLGVSLPNANFQEYLVLSRYLAERMPVNLLIMEIVFDELREDGLRPDFSNILRPERDKRFGGKF